MNCPTCAVELRMTDRQGIEIDYCPKCRGIWLDRGELDKIIERAQPQTPGPGETRSEEHGRYDDDDDDDDRFRQQPGSRNKRRGFLGDLFDFG